jgi:arylsulfatase A-like enzyme
MALAAAMQARPAGAAATRPNVVFVFADQWRAQATGYAGDPNVKTPHLDQLAAESVNFRNAVSGCPVCSPYRGTLMTGRHPDKHGIFVNDVPLAEDQAFLGQTFLDAGYQTGYIGKWHIDGQGRSAYIPRERRRGFEYWKVLECTHDYNQSKYYADSPELQQWEGYDVFAQTRDAQQYMTDHHAQGPFTLLLSWGPPHNPYETAPALFKAMYDHATLVLPPNIPPEHEAEARRDLAGYYAHCSALDQCVGALRSTLATLGIADNTIFVFTSDHGDMLGSQGQMRKQRPWDESIRVPFLLHYPAGLKPGVRTIEEPITTVDLMPTLLGLCDIPVPGSCQGYDWSGVLRGKEPVPETAALLACYTPFGEWTRAMGGREYRGLRTRRYTYVRDLSGPWLFFDNEADPYQQKNLVGVAEHGDLAQQLNKQLLEKLARVDDAFLPGDQYLAQWKYVTDASGTVAYKP